MIGKQKLSGGENRTNNIEQTKTRKKRGWNFKRTGKQA